jgi:glutamyl-tRNA synthetase
VIRFAVPEGEGNVEIEDEVFGALSFPIEEMDDFVVRRSDGRVTYNFAVVVDDIGMGITHVIRGVGHLSNTPKQALVFDALGGARPVFAHLPTVLGRDGRKLSKREGASAVAELRDAGYPSDAIVNYLSLLGWSHPDEREVLSRDELVAAISLDRVGRSDTQMDPEKLSWMGGQHIAAESLADLAGHVRPFVDLERFPGILDRLEAVVDVLRSRLSTYGEVNQYLSLIYPPQDEAMISARAEVAADPVATQVLEHVGEALAAVEPWEAETLSSAIRDAGARAGARGAGIFHPLRVALIGSPKGPDLGKILAALGREEALGRIGAILGEGTV